MNPRYVAALALAVTVVGLIAVAVLGWKRRIKYFAQRRCRLHLRRKQHGLPQAKVEGEPPMPFHVRQGNGPLSTADTDNFFVALRRAFRHRKNEN